MALPFDRRTVAPCNFNESCFDDPTSNSDERCLDPVFAINNPDICGVSPLRLIIKPEAVTRCTDDPIEFETFLVAGGAEQVITSGLTYLSSNQDVVLVSGLTGSATVTGEGIANVTVSWQNLTASAQVTGLGEDCCDDQNVGMMLTIDNSPSMGQAFSALYGTKFQMAKELSNLLAADLNTEKDTMGVVSFNSAANLELGLTDDISAIQTAVASVTLSAASTNLYDALEESINTLGLDSTLEREVIFLFSDGVNKQGGNAFNLAYNFKSGGGIVVVVGLRASGTGFTLLNQIASGGFFINATEDNQDEVVAFLRGLKGYFCAGNCVPPGDLVVNKGKLNYEGFVNWDTVAATAPVDLIGGTWPYQYYDLLPGNGLYVDLHGSSFPWKGKITSKLEFTLEAGKQYDLTIELAGNQRSSAVSSTTQITLGAISETVTPGWLDDFATYTWSTTPGGTADFKIIIEDINEPTTSFGNLLNYVKLRNVTDGITLLEDNFDLENPTYIPPACGYGEDAEGYGGYGYGYDCYGYGCLADPIPPQIPDPDPLPDVE